MVQRFTNAFFNSRHGLATGDNGGKDVTLHGNTKGQRDNVEKKEIRGVGRSGLSRKDTSLYGSTVGNSLVRVDTLLELLAVEEVAQQLLDLGDTGRTTDKDDLVDAALLDTRILENLSNGLQGTGESLSVEVFETGTGDLKKEVLAVEERVNLDGGLSTVGESSLGTLASSPESTESTRVGRDVLLCLALELLPAVVQKIGIEILTTKMGVTSGSLDGEDTALDVQQGHIKGTTTKIVDQDVALLVRLVRAQTVGDSCGGRLVDDTKNVKSGNGTSVLSSLTLVVVEVGRDGDNSLLHLFSELGLGNFLHLRSACQQQAQWSLDGGATAYLSEDHGGNLLGGEGLGLAEVLNLDDGVSRGALLNDLEGP